ncbi:MAG: hypothetical protein Ct9H300mP28_28640 [Pseudomonadota bacterium]|nr:MAG: hypothetical protein Ct9H300mP28_28640 [Pseudomonadota bacterium]
MLDQGWVFDDWKGKTRGQFIWLQILHQHYTREKSEYTEGNVPVLWEVSVKPLSERILGIIRCSTPFSHELPGKDQLLSGRFV